MNITKTLMAAVEGNPKGMVAVHKWLTLTWLAAAIPICIVLASSVPFLVFVSVYAVVTGHWSGWQAARTEVKQEEEAAARRRGG